MILSSLFMILLFLNRRNNNLDGEDDSTYLILLELGGNIGHTSNNLFTIVNKLFSTSQENQIENAILLTNIVFRECV